MHVHGHGHVRGLPARVQHGVLHGGVHPSRGPKGCLLCKWGTSAARDLWRCLGKAARQPTTAPGCPSALAYRNSRLFQGLRLCDRPSLTVSNFLQSMLRSATYGTSFKIGDSEKGSPVVLAFEKAPHDEDMHHACTAADPHIPGCLACL